MKTAIQVKDCYVCPMAEAIEMDIASCLCQSIGGGASEGTGDEDLDF